MAGRPVGEVAGAGARGLCWPAAEERFWVARPMARAEGWEELGGPKGASFHAGKEYGNEKED